MRLTKSHKKEIVDDILKKAFKERRKEVEALKTKIAEDFYKTLYSKEEVKKAESLRTAWLKTVNYVNLSIGGLYSGTKFYFENFKPVEYGFNTYHSLEASTDLGERVLDITNKEHALDTSSKNKRSEIEAVLSDCSTKAKLLKAWPEIENFTSLPSDPVTRELMVNIEGLNNFLVETIEKKS
jgi:hypothetical protein